jgi:glycosyltransferase involved in cell wall biosynthesis
MPEITIVTYTFNRPNLLPRTIKSVLSQTHKDFEYIIINNGSSDSDTPKLLEQYRTLDKRIEIISRPVNDVSTKNFTDLQTLLKNRQTIFLMQVDDDDYMEPETVELLYKLITENDADIATVGSVWTYPDGSSKNKFFLTKHLYIRG